MSQPAVASVKLGISASVVFYALFAKAQGKHAYGYLIFEPGTEIKQVVSIQCATLDSDIVRVLYVGRGGVQRKLDLVVL